MTEETKVKKAPKKKVVKKVKKVVKKNNFTSYVDLKIQQQHCWNENLEKFYNDREGDQFVKSDCSGHKRGVFIGINYAGTKQPLKGCVSDAKNVAGLITKYYGFNDILILTDEADSDADHLPTRSNIIKAMQWLVKDAQPNDSLFFHFSGHGSKVKDQNGDEIDGFDETILPSDYKKSGAIVDDDIYQWMVVPLPRGCRLTAIFDCCHSGTMMDLPYTYQYQDQMEVIENEVRKEIFKKTNEVVSTFETGNAEAISKSIISIFDGSLKNAAKNGLQSDTLKERQALGDVVQLSGCRDNQTTADVKCGSVTTGAMTFALTQLLNDQSKTYSYMELLASLRGILAAKKFAQVPQLSTTRPLNLTDQFTL